MTHHPIDEVAANICLKHGWRLDGFAGSGAFKRVYRCFSPTHGLLALKIITSGKVSDVRTEREIQAMLACDHPHIGKLLLLDVVSVSGSEYVYLVESFFDGGSLTDRINSGMSLDHVKAVAKQLVGALSHTRGKQLVHRDIKPDNIMFDGSKPLHAVLVDFGLVRDLKAQSLTMSWIPRGPGTPLFAPPEQLKNEKSLIDWRSDQYALGVTLSIAGLGIYPYQLDSRDQDLEGMVDRTANRVGPSDFFVELATRQGMEWLIKMTHPWPVNRYRTPEQLISDISR